MDPRDEIVAFAYGYPPKISVQSSRRSKVHAHVAIPGWPNGTHAFTNASESTVKGCVSISSARPRKRFG